MNEQTSLVVGKKYKIFLSNGFKYEGKILSESDTFIQILDTYGKPLIIGKGTITTIEGV